MQNFTSFIYVHVFIFNKRCYPSYVIGPYCVVRYDLIYSLREHLEALIDVWMYQILPIYTAVHKVC